MNHDEETPPPTRSLSSENGSAWDFDEKTGEPVSRIVIGKEPPKENKKAVDPGDRIAVGEGLGADMAAHWETLTCLHLWRVRDVSGILESAGGGHWPRKLRTLDLRGSEIAALPELPDTLEALDVGWCGGLPRLPRNAPPKLKRLYLNACPDLDAETFLEHLAEQDAPVDEIDASGNRKLKNLDRFPLSLRKLVLRGCARLEDAGKIVEMTELDHLDLRDCVALPHLPDLPDGLRHLYLHGAEKLRTFHGQTVGEADLGYEDQNVATDFYTRLKFGEELALMPHAKLLLLGNGRMGKTTLAKRLVWDDLPEAVQRMHSKWKPKEGEPYTHSVDLKTWETFFEMPDWLHEQWEAIDETRRPRLPLVEAGEHAGKLRGTVRIWDFGGQELYHATHRVFAREGSVFLIVWTHQPPKEEPCPPNISGREWREWNRALPLRYWTDYLAHIRSARAGHRALHTRLACTHCPSGNPGDDKLAKWAAGLPANALPECDYVETVKEDLKEADRGIAGLRTLKEWVHTACLDEANFGGRLIKPKFFADTSAFIESILLSNAGKRHARDKTLLFEWDDWVSELTRFHRETNPSFPELTDTDVQSVTTFLHEVGDLFQMGEEGGRAVLVDQKAAAQLIYEMLDPRGDLYDAVRNGRGRFLGRDIGESEAWRDLDERVKKRLLAYMAECRHVVKLADREASISDDDVYLANCRWLLPEYPSDDELEICTKEDRRLRRTADEEMELHKKRAREFAAESFRFEDLEITELEYRDLTALVARDLGLRDAFYFRNSVQCAEPRSIPGLFRMRWIPKGGDETAYTGTVDAVLYGVDAPSLAALREWLETLFSGAGSPFAGRFAPEIREAQAHDLGPEFHLGRFVTRDAFGISSSGRDADEVRALRKWLGGGGVQTYWYLDPDVRRRLDADLGELERLDHFLKGLLRENRMLLVISEGYLAGSEIVLRPERDSGVLDPKERVAQDRLREACVENQYCAVELADAIVKLGEGKRKPEDLMVILKTGGGLRSRDVKERILRFLTNMNQCFRDRYAAAVAEGTERKHQAYRIFFERFSSALADDRFNRFWEIFGTEGEAVRMGDLGEWAEEASELEKRFRVDPEKARAAFEKRFGGLRFDGP